MKIIFSTDLLRPFKILNHLSGDNFHFRNDKGDLKGFQTNFETLFLQVSVTI